MLQDSIILHFQDRNLNLFILSSFMFLFIFPSDVLQNT